MQANKRNTARFISLTALMTALTTVCTLLGINIGSGFVNMGDTMIFVTATVFGPVAGLIAGGLGSFLADLMIYPTTMFFTLVIKGIEGFICGLLSKLILKNKQPKSITITLNTVIMLISSLVMIFGYFFTQWLIWGTKESAIAQLPWDTLQASLSVVIAILLIYLLKLKELISIKKVNQPTYNEEEEIDVEDKNND